MTASEWIRERVLLDELPLAVRDRSRSAIGHFILFHLLWGFSIGIAYLIATWGFSQFLVIGTEDERVIGTFCSVLVAIWLSRVLLGRFEGLTLTDCGLKWSRRGNFWLGCLCGFAACIAAVMIPVAMGFGKFRGIEGSRADFRYFVFWLVFFCLQPLGEELVSRGYPFQILIRRYGFVPAAVVTSAIFALMHLPNSHANWLSTANTFLTGILFACAVARSGDLWLCTGLHTGWNVAMPLLGDNLSGSSLRMTRFEIQCPDPLWCGAGYGIESSIPGVLANVLLLVVIWLLPINARPVESQPAGDGIW